MGNTPCIVSVVAPCELATVPKEPYLSLTDDLVMVVAITGD